MDTLRQHGARYVRRVLEANRWNKRKTCAELDIAYHTLNGYLKVELPGEPTEQDRREARQLMGLEGATGS